jgi:hypothetical protein
MAETAQITGKKLFDKILLIYYIFRYNIFKEDL